MKKRSREIMLVSLLLLVSVLACTINVGGPGYPTPEIPISTESVGLMQQEIQTAVAAGTTSGQVTLAFTETELSSYLYYYLERQSDPLFTNPQVYLRDNQIRIHGTAVQGNFQAFVYIVLTARADDQGNLSIDLTSADFGPLPVPESLLDALTAIIMEAYTGALGPVATGFRLEDIIIADGSMIMTGRIK